MKTKWIAVCWTILLLALVSLMVSAGAEEPGSSLAQVSAASEDSLIQWEGTQSGDIQVPLAGDTVRIILTAWDEYEQELPPSYLTYTWITTDTLEGVLLDCDNGAILITPAALEGQYALEVSYMGTSLLVSFALQKEDPWASGIQVRQDGAPAQAEQIILAPGELPWQAGFTAVVLDQYGLPMEEDISWEVETQGMGIVWNEKTLTISGQAQAGDRALLTASSGAYSASAALTVAALEVEWPEITAAGPLIYGSSWNDMITLTGGRAQVRDNPVPGRFVLLDGENRPEAGNQEYVVQFEPEEERYGSPQLIRTAEIAPRQAQLVWSGQNGLIYSGAPTDVTAQVGNLLTGDICVVTVEGGRQTNAGTYTAQAVELSNPNYCLERGEQCPYEIERAAVRLPGGANFPYSGTTQTGVAEVPGCLVSGGTARDTGWYAAQVTLLDGENYRWWDGAEEATREVLWTIRPADYTLSVPDGTNALPQWEALGAENERLPGQLKLYQDMAQTKTADQAWFDSLPPGDYPVYWSFQTTNSNYFSGVREGVTAIHIGEEQPQYVDLLPRIGAAYGDEPGILVAAVRDREGNVLADHGAVNFFSSDESILTVGKDGTAQILGCGTVTVTARAAGVRGQYTAGSAQEQITIYPRQAQLVWRGTENLTYSGKAAAVTAVLGNLVPGDQCQVAVEGGAAIEIGRHTARAVALSNPNYILPVETEREYVIQKGNRKLTTAESKVVLVEEGERMTLSPSFQDADGGGRVLFQSQDAAVASVSAGGVVTALADGKTAITLFMPETEHYAACQLQIPVQVVTRPVTAVALETGTLTAQVEGRMVRLAGYGTPGEQVRLIPQLAQGMEEADGEPVFVVLGSSRTFSVLVDGRSVEYTVETSGVRPRRPGVAYEGAVSGRLDEALSQQEKDAVQEILNHPVAEADQLLAVTAAEADQLLEQAAQEGAEGLALRAVLEMEISSYDSQKGSLTVEMRPVLRVMGTDKTGTEREISRRELEETQACLHLSIPLPGGFPWEHLYVRYIHSGQECYLPVSVEEGNAEFDTNQFGPFTLMQVPCRKTVTLHMEDGSLVKRTLNAQWIGTSLPEQSREGWSFRGWSVRAAANQADYAGSLTLAQLERLAETAGEISLYPVFVQNSTGGGGAGGGGGGAAPAIREYTVTTRAGAGGTISPSTQVKEGEEAVISITPDTGWELDRLLVDGREVELTSRYTFRAVEDNHTIEALFRQVKAGCLCQAFRDVDVTAWYHPGVEYVLERGLFQGTEENAFSPDMAMSRAMLVTVLHRMAGGQQAAQGAPFLDVPRDSYYAKAVDWAWERGIVSGYSAARFGGDAPLTRQQLAVILYQYTSGRAWVPEEADALERFQDKEQTDPYGRRAVAWAVTQGLMSGVSGDSLDPQGTVTRAQMATIIMQLERRMDG